MSVMRSLWAAVLALALAVPALAQMVKVPPLTAHLVDQAGMLSEDQRSKLEAVLTDYEARTGSQIAVLTVKTTAPEQIEQYSIRVAEAWKLGRKGVDDGVLLLVAPDNTKAMRRLRIEAGRGVQGVLTDAQSKRILTNVIAPHFQQKQFYEGLVAGVGAIATLLNAEQFPAPPPKAAQEGSSSFGGYLLPLLFIGIILYMNFRPRGRSSRLTRDGWGSGAAGFIIGSALGSLSSHGGSSSDSGGGFSSSDSFSGGGGSFDGGGASGDW